MKTQTIISELTHDDLVNLFSTALYGSSYLSSNYEDDVKVDKNDDDCYEDVLAKILLSGGKVKITDYYAERLLEAQRFMDLVCEMRLAQKWNERLDEHDDASTRMQAAVEKAETEYEVDAWIDKHRVIQ